MGEKRTGERQGSIIHQDAMLCAVDVVVLP
jgi:hypothetical protein